MPASCGAREIKVSHSVCLMMFDVCFECECCWLFAVFSSAQRELLFPASYFLPASTIFGELLQVFFFYIPGLWFSFAFFFFCWHVPNHLLIPTQQAFDGWWCSRRKQSAVPDQTLRNFAVEICRETLKVWPKYTRIRSATWDTFSPSNVIPFNNWILILAEDFKELKTGKVLEFFFFLHQDYEVLLLTNIWYDRCLVSDGEVCRCRWWFWLIAVLAVLCSAEGQSWKMNLWLQWKASSYCLLLQIPLLHWVCVCVCVCLHVNMCVCSLMQKSLYVKTRNFIDYSCTYSNPWG